MHFTIFKPANKYGPIFTNCYLSYFTDKPNWVQGSWVHPHVFGNNCCPSVSS